MTLLANKYYICDKEYSRYVPYGYSIYHTIEDTLIYINENNLPVGVVYDSYITKEQFDKLSPLEKEDALITTAMIEDDEVISVENDTNVKINGPLSLEYTVNDNKITDNIINITKKNEVIELRIKEIPDNVELYLSINNLKYTCTNDRTDFKITAKIDGITNSENVRNKTSSAYYMNNPNFLMNLGVTKEKQSNKLKLTFSNKGNYTFDSLEILAVDMKKYEEKVNKLKANVLQEIEYGKDYISGTVNTGENGILQVTTSYSDGWKAYVNGEEVEVLKVNEAFIGINVEAGEHNIRFEYETPYLKLGIVCSIIGLLIFIYLVIINKKKIM